MIIKDDVSDWSKHWLKEAELISERSKDPSSKCGAVIVDGKFLVSKGYNGFPQKVVDSPILYEARTKKYLRVLHSELNAILTARRDLTGMTLYCTHSVCSQCMAAIIQVGITKVITYAPETEFNDRWSASMEEAANMATEAEVVYIQVRRP